MAEQEWTAEQIRGAELPQVFLGGYDKDATRELLRTMAASAESSAAERTSLENHNRNLSERIEAFKTVVEELEAALREQSIQLENSRANEVRVRELEQALEERERSPEDHSPLDHNLAELISSANRTVEELLAHAQDQATRMLEDARREAEQRLGEDFRRAHGGVVELELLLREARVKLAASLETALGAMETSELLAVEPNPKQDELVDDLLRPTLSPNTTSAVDHEYSSEAGAQESYDTEYPSDPSRRT